LLNDLDTYADQQARHGLVVSSYWIGGSFVSGKNRPGDLDFTAVIDGSASSPDPAALSDWTIREIGGLIEFILKSDDCYNSTLSGS
jgi:hypothetical protein